MSMRQKKIISAYNFIKDVLGESLSDKIRDKLSLALKELSQAISPHRDLLTMEEMKQKVKRAHIIGASGKEPDFFNVQPEDVDPYFSAFSLSRIKRFMTSSDFTVAEHCVNLANHFLNSNYSNKIELAKYAMIHELFEQYSGDIATPVKHSFVEIRILEDEFLKRYCMHIGLSPIIPEIVHIADKEIMYAEAKADLSNDLRWEELRLASGVNEFSSKLNHPPLSEKEAQYAFLKMWVSLGLPQNEKIHEFISFEEKLNLHEQWIKNKQNGRRADFSNQVIEGYKGLDFKHRNLTGAIFSNAILKDINVCGAYFEKIERDGLLLVNINEASCVGLAYTESDFVPRDDAEIEPDAQWTHQPHRVCR